MNGIVYLLPGAILGALVGYLIPVIVGMPRYFWQVYKGDTRAEGVWYSYHYSRKSSKPEIRQSRLKIKRNFRGWFAVKCWEVDADSEYRARSFDSKGTAFRERGFLVLTLQSRRYQGHWTIRILDPIVPGEKCVPGLWMSFDLDGKLIAAPIIFARNPVPLAEAELLLRSHTSVSPTNRLLGVNHG